MALGLLTSASSIEEFIFIESMFYETSNSYALTPSHNSLVFELLDDFISSISTT